MTNPAPKPLPVLFADAEQAAQRRHAELLKRLDALAVPVTPADPAPYQELLKRLDALTVLVAAPAEPVDLSRLEAGLDRMTEALGTLLARAELPDDLAFTLKELRAGATAAQTHLTEARESRTAIRSGLTEIGGRVDALLTLRDAVQGAARGADLLPLIAQAVASGGGTDLTPVLTRLDALGTGLGIELGAADLAASAPLSTVQDVNSAAADPAVVEPEAEATKVPDAPAQEQPSEASKPTRKAKTAVQESDK